MRRGAYPFEGITDNLQPAVAKEVAASARHSADTTAHSSLQKVLAEIVSAVVGWYSNVGTQLHHMNMIRR